MVENTEPMENVDETTQEPSESVQEEPKAKEEQAAQTPQEKEYTESVKNWRVLREEKERAERERDELIKRLSSYKPEQPEQEPEEENLSDDDLIEARHLKKERKRNEQRMAQIESKMVESEVRSRFPDFSEVVTKDTIEMLKDSEPEVYATLSVNPDFYSKAVATYKMIKRYGLSKPDYSRQKESIDKNMAKPRPASSIGPSETDSPLSQANAFAHGLSDKRKKEIWAETKAILKGY